MTIFDELVQNVAEATDLNAHTSSITYVAKYFGMFAEVEELEDIHRMHMLIGHMTDNLHGRRRAIYRSVMKVARDFLTDEQYETLYQAF